MRSGGNCGVQQGLTAEAASVVKAAVSLAKRRGHAQVTPLHVANTMLSASNGLLRTACLHSHSHPLQCKALELCFNVALNRLPASNSSSPMLGPSISNALVAAFKRAQAHQRRGSIETQQQPLLAVKIELEQLIISILDDPSVSRVMREAGFSSTQVKTNVQQAVSSSAFVSLVRDEDVRSVVDYLIRNKTSTVVVGECVSSLEAVVRAVMDRPAFFVDHDFKFLSFSLSDFGHASRVDVDKRMDEIRGLATATTFHHKAFVLYVGDLKCVFEYQGRGHYCPVQHVIMEIGKLLTHGVPHTNARFLVIAVATFQTYNRCQNGCPSLHTLWGLHSFTLPASSSLGLTLVSHDCGVQKEWSKKKGENGTKWVLVEGREEEKQGDRFVAETSAKFETQVGSCLPTTTCNINTTTSTQLPAWLQQYKNESKGVPSNDQNCVPVGDVSKKWNNAGMCSSPSVSPSYSSTNSGFSNEQQHPKFWISGGGGNTNNKSNDNEPTLRMYIPEHTSNPNSTTSSGDVVMQTEEEYYVSKFKELNSENLKTLCHALETKVPWQKHIIPEIATTVLQCRSGMLTRKGITCRNEILKEETWLLFQGVDMEGKEKIARELASLVFGSHTNLVSLALSTFSSTQEDSRNKRSRDEQSCSYIKRFADAVSRNPHSVFLVEDIDEADYCSQLGFKRAMETGILQDSNGDQVRLSDAIIILSSETQLTSINQKSSSSPQHHHNIDLEKSTAVSPCVSLDLNISINDCENHPSLHHNPLLQSLDRRIIFNFQEL